MTAILLSYLQHGEKKYSFQTNDSGMFKENLNRQLKRKSICRKVTSRRL